MKIAVAQQSDISTLCGLLNILFTQEAEFTPDKAAQQRGLALVIANPELGAILVAREGENIVGMVSLLYTVSTALGARVALLEDMVVMPQSRGAGIGSLLLQQAIEFAQARGCKRITLLTDGDNETARRFYVKHGFQASAMLPMRQMLNHATNPLHPPIEPIAKSGSS